MIPIASYYLGTTPSAPINSAPFTRHQSMSQASLPHSASSNKAANRASMPAPARTPTDPSPSIRASGMSIESSARATPHGFEPTPEEQGGSEEEDSSSPTKKNRGPPRMRHGTMDRAFKFPPGPPPPVPEIKPEHLQNTRDQAMHRSAGGSQETEAPLDVKGPADYEGSEEAGLTAVSTVAPSSVEVPPLPPVEREKSASQQDEGDEDLGETEEISLN